MARLLPEVSSQVPPSKSTGRREEFRVFLLVLQIDGFLAHLVNRGNYTRVRLVPPLKYDELREFAGNVHRRRLDRATHNVPSPSGIGQADGRRGGPRTGLKIVVAGSDQRLG